MSKHTPGPWSVWECDDSHWWVCETAEHGRHSHFAQISVGNMWGDEGKANAHLIAAAPDMIEALEKIAPTLYNGFEPENQSNIYKLVENAILKARGKL